jgi:phosphoglycolate phosphatase-like HAD superfamily hydrolase
MKLIVFDMDQTLVEVIDVHDEAIRRVFQGFFNIEARLTEIDYAGRSLNESFRVLADLKGLPGNEVLERLPQMLEAYDRAFVASLPGDATGFILPGVSPLLEALSNSSHPLALYTGDSPAVMRRVMEATGLGRYFHRRYCGTDFATRADMVKQAAADAGREAGREFSGKDIVIIGDSVRDVEAGRPFGALVIAVATGKHTREQLQAAGPDYLFDTLADWRAVMKAIG